MNTPPPLPSLLSPIYPGYVWRRKADYGRLFSGLVPASGAAPTLQGELIRAVDKLWFEAQDNGNINWGPDFDAFTNLLDQNLVGGFSGAALSSPYPTTRPQWLNDDDFSMAWQDLRIIRHCGHIAYQLKPEFARDQSYDAYLQANPQIAAEPDGPDDLPDLAYTHSDLYQHLMDCVIVWIHHHDQPVPCTAPSELRH